MAGTVNITYDSEGPLKEVRWEWTSDASGDANGVSTVPLVGVPFKVVTIPDGDAAPTPDYDVVIEDEDGADILQGGGADRHTSNVEQLSVFGSTAVLPFKGALELKVSNAGDSKKGVVAMLYR